MQYVKFSTKALAVNLTGIFPLSDLFSTLGKLWFDPVTSSAVIHFSFSILQKLWTNKQFIHIRKVTQKFTGNQCIGITLDLIVCTQNIIWPFWCWNRNNKHIYNSVDQAWWDERTAWIQQQIQQVIRNIIQNESTKSNLEWRNYVLTSSNTKSLSKQTTSFCSSKKICIDTNPLMNQMHLLRCICFNVFRCL